MKRQEKRMELSRKRQALGPSIVVWEQKVKDLKPHPERYDELVFALSQLQTLKDAMHRLNAGEYKQRTWARGRLL
jgi:hypothetical protein